MATSAFDTPATSNASGSSSLDVPAAHSTVTTLTSTATSSSRSVLPANSASSVTSALDYLTSNILLPLGGIMITIYVSWLISKESINKELNIKSNILRYIWYFSARFIAPIAVIMVMLNALGFSIEGAL